MNNKQRQFQELVWEHYRAAGRHDLPWRPPALKVRANGSIDPYRVFVSEVMLQQTQAGRVVQKYHDFLKYFPSMKVLASAPTREVLGAWQGLGYNRRALALQRAAQQMVAQHGGRVPQTREELIALPGIGPYTAGAVLAFAFNEPVSFIETNIRRAYLDYFFPKREGVTDKEILPLVEATLPEGRARQWYYALMDYGAALGRTHINANRRSAHYTRQTAFEGSDRQLRARAVRFLLERPRSEAFLLRQLDTDSQRVERILASLVRDGFLVRKGRLLRVV